MKRKFILLPILLTAITPVVSLFGCGNPNKPTPPEPEPENYIVLDEYHKDFSGFEYYLCSKTKFTIERDTSYYFKIDTNAWKGPRDAASFVYSDICLCGVDYMAFPGQLSNDFKIWVDDVELDNNLYWLDSNYENNCINIEPEGMEKILNGKNVKGYVHFTNFYYYIDPSKEVEFELFCSES